MIHLRQFLNNLFTLLEQKNIHFAVLHEYETLPDRAASDIDMVIDPHFKDQMDAIISQATSGTALRIIQKLRYDIPYCYYYVMAKVIPGETDNVKIDLLMDDIGVNRYYLTSEELLARRIKYRNFFVPSYDIQAVYLLIKRAVKGKLQKRHYKEIKELYHQACNETRTALSERIGHELAEKTITALDSQDNNKVVTLLPDIHKKLKKGDSHNLIRKVIWSGKRVISRSFRPTGILVALVSPDGGGKSTTSISVEKNLLGCFRNTKNVHWRPGLLPQLTNLIKPSRSINDLSVTTPHNPNKRSKIFSFLRWSYYSIDYILGYYLKLLPIKMKTTAILIERYYYDIIVDPVRYGFNLPQWLLKSILPLIPKPDLTIYFDNSPEQLYRRKQELPITEIERQVKAWREFIPKLPNAQIVTTNKPLEDVVNEVTNTIIDARSKMTRKNLQVDPDESFYLWKSKLSSHYVALPSKKNCRWIVPTNPALAEKAWDLYLPYSFAGKLFKNIMKLLSSKGLLSLLKSNKLNMKLINSTDESGKLKECIEEVFNRDDFALGISTGILGPFCKVTAMIMDSDGRTLGFAKIGKTSLAIKRIKNEANILRGLKFETLGTGSRVKAPECLYDGQINDAFILVQSPAPFEGRSGRSDFNEDYAEVLNAFIKDTVVKKNFVESEFCKSLKNGIAKYSLSFRDLLMNALNYLEETICDKEIMFSLSHGDFAPWNILWSGKKAFIFDWESACLETPAGFDLVHFLFQTGFLLKGLKSKNFLNFLTNDKPYDILRKGLGLVLMNPENLLLAYILHMAVDEDRAQVLSKSAVERRNLINLLFKNGRAK